jgi:hypothetical protein
VKNNLVIFLVLIVSNLYPIHSYSQKNQNIYEGAYLKHDKNSDKYLTNIRDKSSYLKKIEVVGKKVKENNFSMSGNDTIKHYTYVDSTIISTFIGEDFKLDKDRLIGDFKIIGNKLQFFPWSFKDEEINNHLKNYTYLVDIPERSVLKVKFRSFHYGALTIPIKIYLRSRTDSLISNIQTSVNFSAQFGVKKSSMKFSQLPNEKEVKRYQNSYSFNFILGISKIDLNNVNTFPAIKNERSFAAISYGFSLGYQYRLLGLYFVSGIDTPVSKHGKMWNYKNQPWIGVGIGIGL